MWFELNVNALTIGAHEPRSTLRRRSRMEPSGPRRYVTARGRHTGRLRRPAMQDRLRRATLRAAGHAVGAAFLHPLAKATQVKHILGSAAHAARAFDSPPETIPPSEPTTSRSRGSLRIPS